MNMRHFFGNALVFGSLISVSCNNHTTEMASSPASAIKFVGDDTVKGQYIAVLDTAYAAGVRPLLKIKNGNELRSQFIEKLLLDFFGSTRPKDSIIVDAHRYAFLARLNPQQLNILQRDKRVQSLQPYVLKQYEFARYAVCKPSTELTWNVQYVWNASHLNGVYHKAWVLDTGIDPLHTDLNIGLHITTIQGETGNDLTGHGTMVAGIIGAKANNSGVVGVAPNAVINSLKIFDRNNRLDVWAYHQSLSYVSNNGTIGDVLNLSISSSSMDPSEYNFINEIARKGIKVVIAAGNDYQDVDNRLFPASINGSNIYTISSMSQNESFSMFSNFGRGSVDYCAPGEQICSTGLNGQHVIAEGTSFAAPHLSGVILLKNGIIRSLRNVSGDPDGSPDRIIHE